ncbi:hypothetical protein [Deinococcus pimensis]|uniref:hypothetical protein n=1 Tax=Deinococcus pimensis TaxID=309888 RepID=UPI0012F7B553|nr:hypothetical protein [Deinococcus pimensis]
MFTTYDPDVGNSLGKQIEDVRALAHAQYAAFFSEPAFSLDATSTVCWFDRSSRRWQGVGAEDDTPDAPDLGLLTLLLTGGPEDYAAWAEAYFEVNVPRVTVEAVYRHAPLTPELVASLSDDLTLEALAEDIKEIGYPTER